MLHHQPGPSSRARVPRPLRSPQKPPSGRKTLCPAQGFDAILDFDGDCDALQTYLGTSRFPEANIPSIRREERLGDRAPVSSTLPAYPSIVESTARQTSAGAVWLVGGAAVTDVVPAVADGRGGFNTSGSTAEHHYATFLGLNEYPPDPATFLGREASRQEANRQEQRSKHWRRLAASMQLLAPQRRPRPLAEHAPVDCYGRNYVYRKGKWVPDLSPSMSNAHRRV